MTDVNINLTEQTIAKPITTPNDGGNGHREYKPDKKYITLDRKKNPTLNLALLTSDLLTDFYFVTLKDTEEVLIYENGVYQYGGTRFIKQECQHRVGVTALLTEHRVNEVIGHIRRSTYTDRAQFNSTPHIINLVNGLLDVQTRSLKPHTHEYLSTIRIPVNYVPQADCPAIKKFFKEVHHKADIPVIQELFGYCTIADNTIQRAFLYVGDGGNGKSTELNLLRAFIGKENCSNLSWHLLEVNRFAKAALEGKLANIFADLPSQSLNMTTSFKMLTGGDAIGTEKKFKDPYSFINFARLIFSANKPPNVVGEDSFAFWRRWIVFAFPRQFSGKRKDKNLLSKLTTKTELSGLLNWALDGHDRLMKNQDFSYKKTVDETTEFYLRVADPVYAYLQDMTEVSSDSWISKDDLYESFKEYCKSKGIPLLKPNAFGRALLNQMHYRIRSYRPILDGKRIPAWEGIKLIDENTTGHDENVRDVRDVGVFPSTKSRERKRGNIKRNRTIPKNLDNPDIPDGEIVI